MSRYVSNTTYASNIAGRWYQSVGCCYSPRWRCWPRVAARALPSAIYTPQPGSTTTGHASLRLSLLAHRLSPGDCGRCGQHGHADTLAAVESADRDAERGFGRGHGGRADPAANATERLQRHRRIGRYRIYGEQSRRLAARQRAASVATHARRPRHSALVPGSGGPFTGMCRRSRRDRTWCGSFSTCIISIWMAASTMARFRCQSAPTPIVAIQSTIANTTLPTWLPSWLTTQLTTWRIPLAGLSGLAGLLGVLRFLWDLIQNAKDAKETADSATRAAVAIHTRVAQRRQRPD